MGALLEKRAALIGASLFAMIGLGLVGYDILDGIDWPVPTDTAHQDDISARADEVREYVLFTEVAFGKRKVMTGVQYASSSEQTITEQWCYLNDNTKGGSLSTRLALANIAADGARTIPTFDSNALASFGLTETKVHALIKTHCRFQ